MRSLSQHRPVFHSEADFQHALAWELRERCAAHDIRLEYRHPALPSRGYIDLMVSIEGQRVFLELKYKKKRGSWRIGQEDFALLEDGAVDLGRYDFLKDVVRLESVLPHEGRGRGYAIMLTNEPKYWLTPQSLPETIDALFRIHESSQLSGDRRWSTSAGGTTKRREEALNLRREYVAKWHDYSNIDAPAGDFRFLCLEVE